MFLRYRTAQRRVARGFQFIDGSGSMFNLSADKLIKARAQLDTKSQLRCPLALAATRSYPGAASPFLGAANYIMVLLCWGFGRATQFLVENGFDLDSSRSAPNWLVEREWRLLTRAWRELLDKEAAKRPDPQTPVSVGLTGVSEYLRSAAS